MACEFEYFIMMFSNFQVQNLIQTLISSIIIILQLVEITYFYIYIVVEYNNMIMARMSVQ